MTLRSALLFCSTGVLLLLCRAAPADEEALPPGAVARLGTYHFWHGGTIASVAVSPDGKLIASGGAYDRGRPSAEGWKRKHDRRICLWETATGKKVREIATPDGVVACLSFSPDGAVLAAGCGKVVCLWRVADGKEMRVPPAQRSCSTGTVAL